MFPSIQVALKYGMMVMGSRGGRCSGGREERGREGE